jgi:glycosyltransferase involved in cell wall biosynthesis
MTFSVIIPCYNSEETIERALKSVANQSFRDFEIVVVDDGSSDKTREVIEKTEIECRYIYQENSGASRARNRAVAEAKGEFLAFLDSDDEWHKDKLKIQYEYIKKLNIEFISTNYTYTEFAEVDEIETIEYSFDNFIITNRTSTPCTVVSKALFERVGGFREDMRYSEDYNLWLKITKLTPLVTIKNPLVRLYKPAYGSSGLSAKLWQMEKGELTNYKEMLSLGYISLFKYLFLVNFSFLKFIRRVLIAKR